MPTLLRVIVLTMLGLSILCGPSRAQPEIVINQYVDTNSGTTPKGVELKNVGDQPAVFDEKTLEVKIYFNGSEQSTAGNSITSGTLQPGEVLVVGGDDLETYMQRYHSSSQFVNQSLRFNGNDAVEVVYGGIRQDLFGTIGRDPGEAWSGEGVDSEGNEVTVRTADQNIELKPEITSGTPDGFTDPSRRFRRVVNNPTGDDLSREGDLRGFGDADPIPVEFVSFRGTTDGSRVRLTWETASETNNAGFEVEHRGPEETTWDTRGFVDGAGTTSEGQSYRFVTEEMKAGTHAFRLKQVDMDGSTHLTDPQKVRVPARAAVQLTGPNPVPQGRPALIEVQVEAQQFIEVALFDVLGQRIRTLIQRTVSPGTPVRATVSTANLSSGLYLLRAQGASISSTHTFSVIQ